MTEEQKISLSTGNQLFRGRENRKRKNRENKFFRKQTKGKLGFPPTEKRKIRFSADGNLEKNENTENQIFRRRKNGKSHVLPTEKWEIHFLDGGSLGRFPGGLFLLILSVGGPWDVSLEE